jgi:hypothetical protein
MVPLFLLFYSPFLSTCFCGHILLPVSILIFLFPFSLFLSSPSLALPCTAQGRGCGVGRAVLIYIVRFKRSLVIMD